MKKKFFGAVVAPISIVGLTFALGLGTTAFGTVDAPALQQTQTDTEISALDVTTEVDVAPWCGWYVSTSDVTALALVPDVDEPSEYTGAEIALTATAAENTAYVGPRSGLTEKGLESHCSWFSNTEKYGARYDVEATGNKFTASAQTAEPTLDSGMDFFATTANPLKITNVGIASCTSEGFAAEATAELKDADLTTTPWTAVEAGVLNNNFCAWSAKYEIKIPGGMSPLYGNVMYKWVGPTLTHTLVIPEDQTGGDTP